MEKEKLYTVGRIARTLRVHVSEIQEYVRQGGSVVRDGKKIRLRLSDVAPWVNDMPHGFDAFDQVYLSGLCNGLTYAMQRWRTSKGDQEALQDLYDAFLNLEDEVHTVRRKIRDKFDLLEVANSGFHEQLYALVTRLESDPSTEHWLDDFNKVSESAETAGISGITLNSYLFELIAAHPDAKRMSDAAMRILFPRNVADIEKAHWVGAKRVGTLD